MRTKEQYIEALKKMLEASDKEAFEIAFAMMELYVVRHPATVRLRLV